VGADIKTMELKKVQHQPSDRDQALLKKTKVRDFVENIKTEFRNITWTSKEELKVYTQIVVGATFVLGLGVYLIDLSLQSVLNTLTWITRFISG
jgi:preprotein translocase subunit SecE